MKKLLLVMVVSSLSSVLHAESVSWLEDESTVSATNTGVMAKSLNGTNQPSVTLATGQQVALLGNVYVKADDTHTVLTWALNNGYVAYVDTYIQGAVHIEVAADQSIEVAAQVAQLQGVTTAAPRYKAAVVHK